MAKTLQFMMSHVKLVADNPKQPTRYQFEDLEQKSHKSRFKSKTEFKSDVAVGDHVILFTITDQRRKRNVLSTQNYSIVIADLNYANNFYKWLVKHNPDAGVTVQWSGKLTVL